MLVRSCEEKSVTVGQKEDDSGKVRQKKLDTSPGPSAAVRARAGKTRRVFGDERGARIAPRASRTRPPGAERLPRTRANQALSPAVERLERARPAFDLEAPPRGCPDQRGAATQRAFTARRTSRSYFASSPTAARARSMASPVRL